MFRPFARVHWTPQGATRWVRASSRAASERAPSPATPLTLVLTLGAAAGGVLAWTAAHTPAVRSSKAYRDFVDACMPALRALDAESSHDAAIWTLSQGVGPKARALSPDEERLLATRLWGLSLRNPVGLAAGFDKHARAVRGCMDLGFGLVEIGSITPMAQEGNPRPRMFRLTEDAGVINRYGFNSEGVRSVASRLAAHWSGVVAPLGEGAPLSVAAGQGWPLLGVNIGKNKEGDAVADYCDGIRALAPFADYLVINVSSPNTPGLRTLQRRDALAQVLVAARAARDALPWPVPAATPSASASRAKAKLPPPRITLDAAVVSVYDDMIRRRGSPPPLLVKIAPDVTDAELDDIVAVALSVPVDGIIVSNTTLSRPDWLRSANKTETGGLSGAPVFDLSTRVLAKTYARLGAALPLIGVGGVASADDAYAKIRAGASLVQVYSALAYEGPGLVTRITSGLAERLRADGFSNVSEAVGVDAAAVAAGGDIYGRGSRAVVVSTANSNSSTGSSDESSALPVDGVRTTVPEADTTPDADAAAALAATAPSTVKPSA